MKVTMLTQMIMRIKWNTFKSISKAVNSYTNVKCLFTTSQSGVHFPDMSLPEGRHESFEVLIFLFNSCNKKERCGKDFENWSKRKFEDYFKM